MAIGDGADFSFIQELSQDNCGQAYNYKTDNNLIDHLETVFMEVRVPIFSSKPIISVESDCVDQTKLQNDLTNLLGKKFANSSEFDVINIPFKSTIPLTQACEVEIIYTALVKNKPIKEEIKLCFPDGRRAGRRFKKLADLSQSCPKKSRAFVDKVPREDFLRRLREYRDISKIAADNLIDDRDDVVEKAKNANFVVEDLTALVVTVSKDNGQCIRVPEDSSEVSSLFDQQDYEYDPSFESSLNEGLRTPQYNCSLTACSKSNFRGTCITVFDGEFDKFGTDSFSIGPDEIASMKIITGLESCNGYNVYTEEGFKGDKGTFGPGVYKGFKEIGIFYQEIRSLAMAENTD